MIAGKTSVLKTENKFLSIRPLDIFLLSTAEKSPRSTTRSITILMEIRYSIISMMT